jgi:phosphomannomutase
MITDLSMFKDYDVRGTYPEQINGTVAKAIGFAIVKKFQPKSVAICRDMRLSGEEIRDGLIAAFTQCGVNVFDAGLTGTEISYFISGTRDYDMSIMISASHNPSNYNGLKIVLKGPIAVSGDSGLAEIKAMVNDDPPAPAAVPGTVTQIDVFPEWKEKVLSFIDIPSLKPLNIVIDAGNGMAGKLVPKIFDGLPFKMTPMFFELDGRFPNHTPNPLVETNNVALVAKMKEVNADLGLTFDGDADRVFFVDNTGRFVSGTLVTAIMARHILKQHPGEYVLYSAVCGRVVPETIEKYGGKYERVRVGHSFMKNFMRKFNGIFAGEHSGHYYHRDFFNSESGVLTALMMLSLISHDGRKFSDIVDELDIYPASGELNYAVSDIPDTMQSIRDHFKDAERVDELDGLSIWYKDFWINVRSSKTEPLLRLNVEADTHDVLKARTDELVSVVVGKGGILK